MLQEYLGVDDGNLARAAWGFGGGCAGRQSECGALVGGVMAIGLKHAPPVVLPRGQEAKTLDQRIFQEAGTLVKSFGETFGHTYCRTLTGHDFSTPEGSMAYRKDVEAQRRCLSYVQFVVKHVIGE